MDNTIALVIADVVWGRALGAAILALIIAIVTVAIRLIKKASLGSEFKDLEKVLDTFGSTKCIEFDINNNGEEKIVKSFSPKQLSEFIKMKYHNKKQWKNKNQELYQRVVESSNITEIISEDLIEVYYKGLYIKSPIKWSFKKSENNIRPTIITCYNDNGTFIKVCIDKRYSNIEDSIEKNIEEIGEYRSKFIRSTPKKDTINGYHIISVGYAYKFENSNHYGLVIGYQITSDLVAVLHVACENDWSILCSELITQIIDSVKYEPIKEHNGE